MASIGLFVIGYWNAMKVCVLGCLNVIFYRFVKSRLVVLHGKDIIRSQRDNLFGNVRLAPHGVNGNDGPFYIQHF
ncbi:MAG: hypothetical protein BECKG1743D_GA0114223_110823 [Candidatus Kentron sp. G]|nr:MAG: hypothetical protein BECKG1743D_GA0114223_110823 [Candidatus Kentron sp. G]